MSQIRNLLLTLAIASLATSCGKDAELGGGPIVIDDSDSGTLSDSDASDIPANDAGDDVGQCASDCSTVGATRCDGDDLSECTDDGNGCLSWEQTETCGGGEFCSAGQCVSQCQDACSTLGAEQCESGGAGAVAECQTDANGCLVWVQSEVCAGVETCSNGTCAAECTDECGAVNERSCEGDGYKLCGNFDADPCLDWGDVVPCSGEASCSAGYCSVQCTDECTTPGVDQCVPNTAATRTCGDFDGDACLEWGTATNCAADEACSGGACVFNDPCAGVTCNAPPADSCADSTTARNYGTGQCDGAGGCDYGYVDTHCPDGCQNGACVAPTCGGTTCNTPPADVCASSSNLTRYFPIGVCDVSDACSYRQTTILCSEGCFQGACISGSWETEKPPLVRPNTSSMDIVFDPTGNPHIAHCNQSPGDVYYRWRDAAGWQEEKVDLALGYGVTSCQVAINLDAQGRPMMAYHDPTNQDLRFARKEGGTWTLSLIATTGFVGVAPSVSTTPSGQPIVAYLDETTDELKTATLNGASWQTEVVAPWSAAATPVTAMRWSRNGDLHILAGGSRSVANPQNNYNQPPVYLHTRSGNNWTTLTLHDDGFTSRDGIAIAPNGDVLVQIGVVLQVGANDQMIVVRTDGTQVLGEDMVRSIGNLLYTKPVGVFNSDKMLEVVMNDPLHYRLDDHGYWVRRNGEPWDSLGRIERVLWKLGDDNYRLFHTTWDITTPTACSPQCSGRACGNDGCGGVCGTCSGVDSCNPQGQCSEWKYETPDAWLDDVVVAKGADELHTFTYDYSLGLMYSTNSSGAWTSTATNVDDTMSVNGYDADAVAIDSNGYIHIATLQARPTHYNAYDKIEVFSQGPMGWTSTIAGQLFQSGQALGFVIDANDVWHFAISERRYPDYAGSQLAYVRYENGTSTKEVIKTPVDQYNRGYGHAYQPRLALDSQGDVHILWVESLTYTSQVSLHFATNASGAWVDTEVIAPFASNTIAFEIDANDLLHASYTQSGNKPFQYGTYDAGAGTWSWEDGPFNSQWRQFGIDPSGKPFVTLGAQTDLQIHRRAGAGNWAIESIPVYGGGSPIRVAFDDVSNMHVIYSAGGGYAQYQTRHVWK